MEEIMNTDIKPIYYTTKTLSLLLAVNHDESPAGSNIPFAFTDRLLA